MNARGIRFGVALCATLGLAMAAKAADQPISAIKLIIKIAASGKEKLVFVAKDPGFLFPPIGSNDDPGNGSPGGAIIDLLTRDGGNATFNVPPGESPAPGWKVKDGVVDLYKYINKDAPAGPVPCKVVVLKETKVIKAVCKETGVPLNGQLNDVVFRITTGGTRNCARFDAATILQDEPGKFIAKGAVASSLTDCASGPPTTSTSSTTSSSTSTSTSSTTTTSTSSTTTTSTSTSSTTTTSTSTSSTTTTSTSSTTSTSTSTSSTTTTSTSSTTSTSLPTGTRLVFTTTAGVGVCGEARTGGSAGTILKTLGCGGLSIGGGDSTVPEGPTPANAPTQFNTACAAGSCTVTARTAVQTGSNTNCSDTACVFGPYLSIANGGLSTCVRNTFASPASGTLNGLTGAFSGSIPLTSTVTVTGNNANPCPNCTGGICDPSAANAGAACTAINAAGDTYQCNPSGVGLAPFGVNLTPISTGTNTATGPGGTFCPGQDATAPGKNGCFGCDGTADGGPCPADVGMCDYYEVRGADAGLMSPGAHAGRLASAFCIPATTNGLIDGAADLPGPGATTLPGTLQLFP